MMRVRALNTYARCRRENHHFKVHDMKGRWCWWDTLEDARTAVERAVKSLGLVLYSAYIYEYDGLDDMIKQYACRTDHNGNIVVIAAGN